MITDNLNTVLLIINILIGLVSAIYSLRNLWYDLYNRNLSHKYGTIQSITVTKGNTQTVTIITKEETIKTLIDERDKLLADNRLLNDEKEVLLVQLDELNKVQKRTNWGIIAMLLTFVIGLYINKNKKLA